MGQLHRHVYPGNFDAMWRPWVAGLAVGTCHRPYQSAGTSATWPSQ